MQLQPAMITLFDSKNSDEMVAREAVKEHLWGVYFSDYGRLVFPTVCLSVCLVVNATFKI